MTSEIFTLKDKDGLKETVEMFFDDDDVCFLTVRRLNGNITSVQDKRAKFLNKKEYPDFIK